MSTFQQKCSQLSVQATAKLAKQAVKYGFSPLLFHHDTKHPNWNGSVKWTLADSQLLIDYIDGKSGNIGIRTGKQSNVIIFDCDIPRNGDKNPINGVKEFTTLLKNNGLIKKSIEELDTVMDKSGSGGMRIYFKYQSNLSNETFKWFKDNLNIDILSDKKACIYPGSIYPGCSEENIIEKHKCSFKLGECQFKGAFYEWIKSPKETDIASLPESLVKMLQKDEEEPSSYTKKSFNTIFTDHDIENVRKMLSLVKDDAWDCSRSQWIIIVWALLTFGFSDEEIHAQCARGRKYEKKTTNDVIRDYKPHDYTYGPKSSFYKWVEENLLDGIQKHTLQMFLPNHTTLSQFDERAILDNLTREHEGTADMFCYFWARENLKTWGTYGRGNSMVMWDESSRLWKKCDSSMVYKQLVDCLRPILKSYKTEDIRIAERIANLIKSINKHTGEAAIMDSVSNSCIDETFIHKCNKVSDEIPTLDGKLINLRTLETRERTKLDLWSTCTLGKQIPLDQCKDADQFLDQICCNSKEQKLFLKILMGYCLTREVSMRKLFIMYGSGRNGKSVFADIVKQYMGEFFQAGADSLLLARTKRASNAATPELMNLCDARLTVIPETDKHESLDTVRVKTLTSGDTITGRCNYGDQISFELRTKLWLLTNDMPNIHGSDQAMVDRICLVPFDAKFKQTKENISYVEKLKNMKDQFFTIAIHGAYEFYKHGEIPQSKTIIEKTLEYADEMDEFQQFIDENIIKSVGNKLTTKELACLFFSTDKPDKTQLQTINNEFTKHGFVKNKGRTGTFIENIRFKTCDDV